MRSWYALVAFLIHSRNAFLNVVETLLRRSRNVLIPSRATGAFSIRSWYVLVAFCIRSPGSFLNVIET